MCSSPQAAYVDSLGVHIIGPFKSFTYVGQILDEVKKARGTGARFVMLPCGKCLSCRMSVARDWSFRCECELQSFDGLASFLTLTYNDDHLRRDSTGRPCLFKDDYQRFLKRLRKSLDGSRISYFGCGEYGSRTLRPHYHFILFGYRPPDLSFWSMSDKGFPIFRSPSLETLWTDEKGSPLGYSTLGSVDASSIDYVARYNLKKCSQDFSSFEVPPFTASSRRPAIGLTWWHRYGSSLVRQSSEGDVTDCQVIHRGKRIPLPRFFLKHVYKDFPDDVVSALIHFRRQKLKENFSVRGLDLLSDRAMLCDDVSIDRFLLDSVSSVL